MSRLLVDFANATKAGFHVNGKLKTSKGLQTGMTVNFLAQIRGMLVRHPEVTKVYLLMDDSPCWRHDFFPDYKLSRREKIAARSAPAPGEPDFGAQRALLLEVLQSLPVRVIFGHKLEADDLAGIACRADEGENILLSNDYDWLQLLSDRTCVWQTKFKRMITKNNLQAVTEYRSIDEIMNLFSICGDGSEVPGVVGVGEKTALAYLRGTLTKGKKFEDIKAWMDDPKGYMHSRQLFDLSYTPPELAAGVITRIHEMERTAFLRHATTMEWSTVLDKSDWLDPWKRLH